MNSVLVNSFSATSSSPYPTSLYFAPGFRSSGLLVATATATTLSPMFRHLRALRRTIHVRQLLSSHATFHKAGGHSVSFFIFGCAWPAVLLVAFHVLEFWYTLAVREESVASNPKISFGKRHEYLETFASWSSQCVWWIALLSFSSLQTPARTRIENNTRAYKLLEYLRCRGLLGPLTHSLSALNPRDAVLSVQLYIVINRLSAGMVLMNTRVFQTWVIERRGPSRVMLRDTAWSFTSNPQQDCGTDLIMCLVRQYASTIAHAASRRSEQPAAWAVFLSVIRDSGPVGLIISAETWK